MKIFLIIGSLIFLSTFGFSQQFYFPSKLFVDSAQFNHSMIKLAKQVIKNYKEENKETYFDNLFRLQLTASEYENSIITLDSLQNLYKINNPGAKGIGFQFQLYATAKRYQTTKSLTFNESFKITFSNLYSQLPEPATVVASRYFDFEIEPLRNSFETLFKTQENKDSISFQDAKMLCRAYNSYNVYSQVLSLGKQQLKVIESELFIIDDSVLIKTRDGATISATIVRKRNIITALPAIFVFNIYAGNGSIDKSKAKQAAIHGYVGVVANTRGKRFSPQEIEPFEHDANDAYDIIDWISNQSWCNGKVGMYGGSYLGFSQWAAVKNIHPALKTIVPQVAVGIGIDYPMQNNIFMSYMLRWIHYVTNNKQTDENEFNNEKFWDSVYKKWYISGKSFRSLDSIEGRPSKIFQRWLQHPSYDTYWQNMIPFKNDFSKINIPILTITGYYDDDQLGAMYYFKQHYEFNKKANHYLLLGPYDHVGAQGSPSANLLGYNIDSVANINITDLVFKWFDYTLKDSIKPALLKDKINYEVMGANEWRHASSLDNMNNDTLLFYFSNIRSGMHYKLLTKKPLSPEFIRQELDYNYRGDTSDIMLEKLITNILNTRETISFTSEPLEKDVIITGSFFGEIKSMVNKKDFDLTIELFEQFTDGRYFALNNFLGRASYAKDISKRQLLQPGRIETIPYNNSFFTSKKLRKGNRIIILIGINKNKKWQINYGTGKDVSDETINDGKMPLEIKWFNESFIKIPYQNK